jgi:site-specific DNA-adenine methylase
MAKKFTLQDAIDASLDYSGKKSIPSYMKWSGNKNHPEYLRGYRTALRNAGRNRRYVDPFAGSASLPFNLVPGQEALLSDFDDMNIGFHNAVKEGTIGDELDFSDFMRDGVVNRKTFFEDLRGGTPSGRIYPPTDKRSYPLDTRWPPRKNSLNYIINELNEANINPASNLEAIKAWARMQNAGFRGDARFNQKPARGVKRWYNISANEENYRPVKRNYYAYRPLMENFNFVNMDVFDFLNDMELDPKRDFMPIDSPYIEEAGNYDHGIDHRKLARVLGSLKDEGMPIVATNSELAMPLYQDEGFDTFLMDRRNNSGAKRTSRGIKPEMVAVTPGLISEREWKGPRIQKSLFEIAWGLV